MKNKVGLIVALLCISSLLKGQDEFQDGYVIKSPGDTLFGLIMNQSYYENSLACIYKSKADAKTVTYSPDEIYGYRFKEGKYYISKEIEENRIKSRYFLEYLIHGKLNIYFKQTIKGTNQYYADKDSLPTIELDYKSDVVFENEKYIIKESGRISGLLKYYTSDCPQVWNDAFNIKEPTHKKLIKFAEKYHNKVCSDNACIVYEKNKSVRIEFEINGGIQTNSVNRLNSFGCMLYFQKPEISENLYLGLGISNYDILSLIVLHNKNTKGLSLIYGGGIAVFVPKIVGGIKYQGDILSVRLYGDGLIGLAGGHAYGINLGFSWIWKN